MYLLFYQISEISSYFFFFNVLLYLTLQNVNLQNFLRIEKSTNACLLHDASHNTASYSSQEQSCVHFVWSERPKDEKEAFTYFLKYLSHAAITYKLHIFK